MTHQRLTKHSTLYMCLHMIYPSDELAAYLHDLHRCGCRCAYACCGTAAGFKRQGGSLKYIPPQEWECSIQKACAVPEICMYTCTYTHSVAFTATSGPFSGLASQLGSVWPQVHAAQMLWHVLGLPGVQEIGRILHALTRPLQQCLTIPAQGPWPGVEALLSSRYN